MAWNHKTKITTVAIAIQTVAGVFTTPTAPADLIAVGSVTNGEDQIQAEDPTMTGSVWNAARIHLGKTGNLGFTMPLRGPGGVAPPAANAWVPGRVLQSAGFAEVINPTPISGTAAAGGTTTAINLAVAGSAVDDFYLGMPIQHPNIGTAGTVKGTSMIMDYIGSTKTAVLAETMGAAVISGTYVIPANLTYLLGTLSSAPPLLSVSIWRDKKRYNYRDVRPTSLTLDMPVSNEANQVFPSLEAQFKGLVESVIDESSPVLPNSALALSPPSYRAGKFSLDKTKLGHQSNRFAISSEVAGASNSHMDAGQDGYEIMSGDRTLELDLNQMAVADFAIDSRVDNQTVISQMSVWGLGLGNRFGFVAPELMLNPLNNPGDRNGFVNLTGNAAFAGVDKSAALTIFWA